MNFIAFNAIALIKMGLLPSMLENCFAGLGIKSGNPNKNNSFTSLINRDPSIIFVLGS